MIRATTGGVMRTYRSNLMNSFINMNASRNTVLTQRNFNSFAEDPGAAAKAFRLRKSRMTVESQYAICTDTYKKHETAVACLQSIDDILCTKDGIYGKYMTTLTGTTLEMLNDPTGDAREQLSKVLDQLSLSVIQAMNQKYGDNFIFSGADGHNVPFEVVDDVLYYRGVPVDAAIPDVLTDGDGNPLAVSASGEVTAATGADTDKYLNLDGVETITREEYDRLSELVQNTDDSVEYVYDEESDSYTAADPGESGDFYKLTGEDGTERYIPKDEYEAAEARLDSLLKDENGDPYEYTGENDEICYIVLDEAQLMDKSDYDKQVLDCEKLQYLANETSYVDIGYGFQEDPVTGKLIESSAFNAAINGINFLGYGLDEDGDPRNLYSLAQRMREIADTASKNDTWSENWDDFNRLVGKYQAAISNYQTEFVNLDAGTGKLSKQQELLVDNFDNLQEQYSDIEDVDMVDAITSFIWAEYCYNAALKVGNSILSESLMDYLR